MGKITMDLAAMFPQTFGDQDALRRAATAEQLQNAQLNAYTQNQQEKDVIRSNQVLPFEDFKIDVNGEQIPFKALPPEQKSQWAKQRQVDWELEQSRKFTKESRHTICQSWANGWGEAWSRFLPWGNVWKVIRKTTKRCRTRND